MSSPLAKDDLYNLQIAKQELSDYTQKMGAEKGEMIIEYIIHMALPKFYKYLKGQFADSMLQTGNLRIGTVYEYRSSENEQVRDVGEGTATGISIQREGKIVTKSEELPPGANEHLDVEGGQAKINMEGCTFQSTGNYENRHIYCVTAFPSEAVMKEFECEKCIEILDIEKFILAIVKHLYENKLIDGAYTFNDCLYNGRDLDYNHPSFDTIDIYYLKDPFYSAQKEFRLLFGPTLGVRVKPIIADIPDIKKYIKLYSFQSTSSSENA